jgi:hypothetical protein
VACFKILYLHSDGKADEFVNSLDIIPGDPDKIRTG